MKIKKFDQANMLMINKEISLALSEIGKKYGIKLSAGTSTFDERGMEFRRKITANTIWDGKLEDLELNDHFYIKGKEYIIKTIVLEAQYVTVFEMGKLKKGIYKVTLETLHQSTYVPGFDFSHIDFSKVEIVEAQTRALQPGDKGYFPTMPSFDSASKTPPLSSTIDKKPVTIKPVEKIKRSDIEVI